MTTSRLDVVPRTIPGTSYVSRRTAVALPPSDLDPGTVVDGVLDEGLMRVMVNGSQILRPFDATLEQP